MSVNLGTDQHTMFLETSFFEANTNAGVFISCGSSCPGIF